MHISTRIRNVIVPLGVGMILFSACSPATITVLPRTAEKLAQEHIGSFAQWSKVEIDFAGPQSQAMGGDNPFKIIVDVTFTAPDGQTHVVPAFYDGNGQGGPDGNVWRVRFSPNQPGEWTYSSTSEHPLLNGYNGTFSVTEPENCTEYVPGALPDLDCVGWLQYAENERYLRFANGTFWLKGGSDDPEDFLAPNQNAGFANKQDAIDFLAEHGANSQYLMLSNVDGDGNNVWPWVGATPQEAKGNHERFDIAKLAEWENIFSALQAKGIVLHLVWEDDAAWTGFNRDMFYREIVARFSHHNGLYWNLGEEYNENYSPEQVREFAQKLRDLDPYDHPITIHNEGSLDNWLPFIGDTQIQITSLQTELGPQNQAALDFANQIRESGHVIPVSFDETGKIAATDRKLSRHIVWSVLLAGANFELHMSPLERFEDFTDHLKDMRIARTLIESWPYYEMTPQNDILTSGSGYAFGIPDETYIVYLPEGGNAEIQLPSEDTFSVEWFDPRTGQRFEGDTIHGGSPQSPGQPPEMANEDWGIILNKQ